MPKTKSLITVLLAGVLLIALVPLAAAQGQSARIQIHQVEVDKQAGQVHAYFSVLDASGAAQTGLDASSFVVEDNGRPLPEGDFSLAAERIGLAAIILIDVSGSMLYPVGHGSVPPRIQTARELIQEFTDNHLRDGEDYVGIIAFHSEVVPLLELSAHSANDTFNAYGNINAERFKNTALYNTVAKAIDWFESDQSDVDRAVSRREKVILVFSDGNNDVREGDPAYPSLSYMNVESRFLNTGNQIPVFSVGINTLAGSGENRYEGDDIRALSETTNGRYLEYTGPDDLATAQAMYDSVAQLGEGYHLVYTPRRQESNHRLTIRLREGAASSTADFAWPLQAPKIESVQTDPVAGVYPWEPRISEVRVDAVVAFPDDEQRGVELLFTISQDGQPVDDPVSYVLPKGTVQASHTWAIPDPAPEDLYKDRGFTFQVKVRDTILTGEEAGASEEIRIRLLAPPTPIPTPTFTPIPTDTPIPTATPGPVEVIVEPVRNWLPLIILALVVVLVVLVVVFRRQLAASAPVQGAATAFRQVTQRMTMSPVIAELTITEGGQVGSVFKIRKGQTIIGRSDECDITIADRFVSGRHAQIEADERGVFITDLGSANGTQLDGAPLEPGTGCPLRSGQKIKMGDTVLKFEQTGDSTQREDE